MALDADEEILQDFLVEAGEILEKLSEELVDLEQNPTDGNLLNSIFRGFHTVKGGAGFLQLDPLVNCCHSAENVFDTLRNHKRQVTSDLMDVVLEALDSVNNMFDQVRSREEPESADPELIKALDALAKPESEAESPAGSSLEESPAHQEPSSQTPPAQSPGSAATEADASDSGDITDDEFEQLLDALEGEKAADKTPASTDGGNGQASESKQGGDDVITDDEFESLLDDLHGKGKHAGTVASEKSPAEETSSKDASGSDKKGGKEGDKEDDKKSDEITDDEFESLLDDLHGKGQFKAKAAPDSVNQQPQKPAPDDHAGGQQAAAAKPRAEAEQQPAAPAGQSGAAKTAPVEKPEAKAAPPAETSVRVDTKRLDDIMNMVGELVLVRNRLQRLGSDIENEHMNKAVGNLDVVTSDLQSAVMQTRMQPIKKVFGRFPRVVRDLARSLKKEINLEMYGEETDLDKNLVEALSDPLVHLVRNSVDHGIETPDVREKSGKPRKGVVKLSAAQEGDHIELIIEDDGAGMDPDKLRQKAVDKGLYEQEVADRLTHAECFNLIFAPGFSTKDQISDVSGRGVGMDVVKTKISQLNGMINVESEPGKGSRIIIKVPLTLAIMPTLMIKLGDQAFALPLVNVVEIFHLDLSKTNIVDGRECIVVRDRVFPVFHIKRWLVPGADRVEESGEAHVVIVAMGTRQVGFVVDQLVGQEEVVIKPLGRILHGTPGMAGATITGDGRIALIIDVPTLLQHYG